MSRQKGSPKTGGRKRGTPNRVTTDLKTWVASILDDGRDRFLDSLDQLDSTEYVRVFTSLLNYVLPKQQSVGIDAKVDNVKPMTIEEAKKIIADL